MALKKRPAFGDENTQNNPQPTPDIEETYTQDEEIVLELDNIPTFNTPTLSNNNPTFIDDDEEDDIVLSTVREFTQPEPDNTYTQPSTPSYPEPTPISQIVEEEPFNNNDDIETEDEDDDEDIIDEYQKWTKEDINVARELLDIINDTESSEVIMNGPATILYKKNGIRAHAKDIVFSSVDAYHEFIDSVLLAYTDTKDRIVSEDNKTDSYLIEGQLTLPDFDDEEAPPLLARVHIIAPPIVSEAKVTIAKKSRYQLTLSTIVNNGSMSQPMGEFLKAITRARVTTVFSGLSGSGKTTLLEALSHEFDPNERAIIVEDTPELRLPLTDAVYLHSTSSKPGSDPKKAVTLEFLVSSTNRMRPDRIIVGEVRGAEMSEFLIAANSGADGSLTTMHAANPKLTLDKMISLSMKSSTSKSEISVARDIASTVQIIIQMSLIEGKHIVTHIEEVTRVINKTTGSIQTATLFEYDRNTGQFQPKNRPSAEFLNYCQQRGVDIDMSWFRGII